MRPPVPAGLSLTLQRLTTGCLEPLAALLSFPLRAHLDINAEHQLKPAAIAYQLQPQPWSDG